MWHGQDEVHGRPGQELSYITKAQEKRYSPVTTPPANFLAKRKEQATLILWSIDQVESLSDFKQAFLTAPAAVTVRILNPELTLEGQSKESIAILNALSLVEKKKVRTEHVQEKAASSERKGAEAKPKERIEESSKAAKRMFGMPPLDKKIVSGIREDRREGTSIRAIAKKWDVSPGSVTKYTKDIKIEKPVKTLVHRYRFDTNKVKLEAVSEDVLGHMKAFLRHQRSELTKDTYYGDLKKFCTFCALQGKQLERVSMINEALAQDYIDRLKEEGQRSSVIRRIFACLSSFMNYCVKREITPRNEVALVKLPPRKPAMVTTEGLEPHELQKILEEAFMRCSEADTDKKRQIWHRNFTMFYLLASVGMRIGALFSIRKRDVIKRYGTTTIVMKAKKGDVYKVPVEPKAASILWDFIAQKGPSLLDEDHLFVSRRATKEIRGGKEVRVQHVLHRKDLNRIGKELARACGIKKHVVPQSFRVTFATQNYLAGMDETELQKRMNHKHREQTSAYIVHALKAKEQTWMPDFSPLSVRPPSEPPPKKEREVSQDGQV